jgi:hypothetical protein
MEAAMVEKQKKTCVGRSLISSGRLGDHLMILTRGI